jgi:hypothetical protein
MDIFKTTHDKKPRHISLCNIITKLKNQRFCNNISNGNCPKAAALFGRRPLCTEIIKPNPAHRPIKAQFMSNGRVRALGTLHPLAN